MKLKLVADAGRVIRHAWSVRLMLISFLFDGLEFGIPFLADDPPIERGLFFALSVAVKVAALAFRFIAQKEFKTDGDD